MAGNPRTRRASLRERALASAFEALYHNRTLYWLASTLPFAGQWRVWQRRAMPRLVGFDVLEVGCGTGRSWDQRGCKHFKRWSRLSPLIFP